MKNYKTIIDGNEVGSSDYMDVMNPSIGKSFAQFECADKETVNKAVLSAKNAFPSWRDTAEQVRVDLINKVIELIEQNTSELMELIALETGKPLNGLNGIGAGMEVGGSIVWAQYTNSLNLNVDVIQDDEQAYIEVQRNPIGVVASITPWNWPLMIATWHIIPAIRTGNTVVIKPSPLAPLAVAKFVELANTILPPGVLNLVMGGDEIGRTISEHKDINKIIFTGSTATGKKIMASAANNLKRLTLELGGNDAGIILPDVDVDDIADTLFTACFHNNGQTCACLKRLYVHSSIYKNVCDALVNIANKIQVGNALESGTELGPLQNKQQLEKVKELVADAVNHGATVLNPRDPEQEGYFFMPTIIGNISDGQRLVDEEQFGPVIPVIEYTDLDEVIKRANNSENGLGASVWSGDIENAKEIATQLEAGSVWINNHGAIQPNAPFGGVKQSGLGVEFGQYGLEEFVTLKTVKVCKS